MIDAGFVKAITDLAGPKTIDVGDRKYSSLPMVAIEEPKEPVAAALEINTLTGLVAYMKKLVTNEHSDESPSFIHVVDHRTVHVVSGLFGTHRQREYFVKAKSEDLFNGANNGFQFNKFFPHSTFMIAIQTLVQPHLDWAMITRVIGTIKEEAVKQSQDDGLSQSVTAKAGIAIVADVEVPRIVTLKPYRTFREVEQPSSQFVLRLQAKPGQLPEIALFEADGGKWKNDAIEAISDYLSDKLTETVIIA